MRSRAMCDGWLQMKGLAKVAMFSCTESNAHQQFCNEKGVQGYPTVIAFGRAVGEDGVKPGIELEMQHQFPAVAAMQVAATILKLNSNEVIKQEELQHNQQGDSQDDPEFEGMQENMQYEDDGGPDDGDGFQEYHEEGELQENEEDDEPVPDHDDI